ncbi:MAG: S1 RNA-binding domain-containing protein [Ilumatobacteraceae bacterium]
MNSSKAGATDVVVVDGSNIATEGRSTPSLAQLNDAVMAFRDEFPDAVMTVVVDATFGHRIASKETGEFDAAVAHNELVAPPAGAIGRGDAFVLSIANKVGARILSNDSFQEFHGDYPWLFDEGRLIGGKPVPYVGWVFVPRLPVKGPTSRKSQRDARGGTARPVRRSASKEASRPMPVPTAPPPSARRSAPAKPAITPAVPAELAMSQRPAGSQVNDVLPFLDFVEHHPIGSSVNGVVESYSSHGAYVSIGDLRGYVPLRLMSESPPRSARDVMRVGDAVTLVVISFAAARRSVDLAVPAMAPGAGVVPTPELEELAEALSPAKRAEAATTRRKRSAAALPAAATATPGATGRDALPAVKKTAGKRTAAKQQTTASAETSVTATAPGATRSATKRTSKQAAPVEKAPVKSVARKTAAKSAPARSAAVKKTAAAKRTAAGKAAAKTSATGEPTVAAKKKASPVKRTARAASGTSP